MEFVHISDMSGFFKKVNACEGAVTYTDKAGKAQDLKEIARQFEKLTPFLEEGELHGLQVNAQRQGDAIRLIEFMAQMNY